MDERWVTLFDKETGEESVGLKLTEEGWARYQAGERDFSSGHGIEFAMDIRRVKLAEF